MRWRVACGRAGGASGRQLAPLLEPYELPRLHAEDVREGDDGGETRVERLAGVRLALLELLVREGGDASV